MKLKGVRGAEILQTPFCDCLSPGDEGSERTGPWGAEVCVDGPPPSHLLHVTQNHTPAALFSHIPKLGAQSSHLKILGVKKRPLTKEMPGLDELTGYNARALTSLIGMKMGKSTRTVKAPEENHC